MKLFLESSMKRPTCCVDEVTGVSQADITCEIISKRIQIVGDTENSHKRLSYWKVIIPEEMVL